MKDLPLKGRPRPSRARRAAWTRAGPAGGVRSASRGRPDRVIFPCRRPKVAFALRQHHVLSDADADALALAAAKRAQTVPLAEALHAVLFRGKDAAVSEAEPKPQGPRAVLPL